MNDIYTVCCDTLEFDVELYNDDGTPFVLDANDNLWFAVKKSYSDITPLIYIVQHDTHFKITQITPEIVAGVYMYEIGILFEDGTEKTVITGARLIVEERLKRDAGNE